MFVKYKLLIKMEQTTKKSKTYLIYWLIILLLAGYLAYTIYDKIQKQKLCQQTIVQLENTAAEKDSLQLELEQIYIQYDQLKTNNDTLNLRLKKEKQKVAKLLEELRRVKATDKQKIEQLKQEVALLRNIMKSYVRQIDSLYQKNQILMAENKKIKEQYSVTLVEKQNLEQITDSLKQKVELAQELEARDVTFRALNRRDRKTRRIKRTKKFEVCFTILANKIATPGKKLVYLRIAKPDGDILINSQSSTFTYEGKEIFYSAVKEIDYQGKDTPVCIYYVNDTKLPPGTYTAFVFIDGKQILSQQINLK